MIKECILNNKTSATVIVVPPAGVSAAGKRYMRTLVILLIMLTLLSRGGTAMALGMAGTIKGESFNHRIDAAERLLLAVSHGDTNEELRTRIVNSVPERQGKQAVELVRQLPFNQLRITLRACLAKTYTIEELNFLARFYESPVGQSILKKDSTLFANPVLMLHKELARMGARLEWTSAYPDVDTESSKDSSDLYD